LHQLGAIQHKLLPFIRAGANGSTSTTPQLTKYLLYPFFSLISFFI